MIRYAAQIVGMGGVALGYLLIPLLYSASGEAKQGLVIATIVVVACFGIYLWGRRPWKDC